MLFGSTVAVIGLSNFYYWFQNNRKNYKKLTDANNPLLKINPNLIGTLNYVSQKTNQDASRDIGVIIANQEDAKKEAKKEYDFGEKMVFISFSLATLGVGIFFSCLPNS